MPASYSGLQFNMFPKSALKIVFPRPLDDNNPMVRKKKEKKSKFRLNICKFVVTWSTSTEKSEPSPRPQYMRPEVVLRFGYILHCYWTSTCNLNLRQHQRNRLWQDPTIALHLLIIGDIPDRECWRKVMFLSTILNGLPWIANVEHSEPTCFDLVSRRLGTCCLHLCLFDGCRNSPSCKYLM